MAIPSSLIASRHGTENWCTLPLRPLAPTLFELLDVEIDGRDALAQISVRAQETNAAAGSISFKSEFGSRAGI
jgi:hypothetical protein